MVAVVAQLLLDGNGSTRTVCTCCRPCSNPVQGSVLAAINMHSLQTALLGWLHFIHK